jgi:glycogen synthase
MRVLMSADAVGGVWTYASELRDALEAEVILAVVGPRAPEGELHLPGRLEWQEDPWDDVEAAGDRLRGLADEHDVDVVHLNQYAFGALEFGRPTLVVGHSCVLSWHAAVRGAPAGEGWGRYADAVRAGLAGADAVVAPTSAMLAELHRYGGVRSAHATSDVACADLTPPACADLTPWRVIHNGISPAPAGAAREPVVLAAGRLWDEAKGLDVLDRAARMSPWPIEVAGDAGAARAQHVRLLGALPRPQLRERMGRATVFAHPARYEPFGLAPLEAAAAGCALVLGNIPSLRELWEGAALFVAPGDPEALAIALELLASDGALRERLAGAARERAAGRTVERTAAAYHRLYRELAGTRRFSRRSGVHA